MADNQQQSFSTSTSSASQKAQERAAESVQKANTPVVGQAPGVAPSPPSSERETRGFGGGRVTFTETGNRLVDNKIANFGSRSAYETYLAERGISNTGQIVNQGLFEKADWSQLRDYEGAKGVSSLFSSEKPIPYTENYGYAGGVKVSPLVASYSARNPNDVNFEPSSERSAMQARERMRESFSKDQGGVITEKSKGKSFGYEFASNASQKIGTKIFSNQKEFDRKNTTAEELFKSKEAERASTVYPSYANTDYITGGQRTEKPVVDLGKAQSVFGKGKTSFGWKDITTGELVRGSKEEQQAIQTEQQKASNVFTSQPQTGKNVLSPEEFNAYLTSVGKKGKTIDIFSSSGSKIGTMKPDEFGVSIITQTVESQPGSFVRETRQPSGFVSSEQRTFADYISTYGGQGAKIELFSGGKKVATVSGPNAYREAVLLEKNYPSGITSQVVYSTTQEGKAKTQELITKANQVGASSIDVYFQGKGTPEKIESIPISKANQKLPSILNKYAGNTNIFFATTPKQIEQPKETTSVPAAVLPLELNYLSSKDFTGKYFSFEQEKGRLIEHVKNYLAQPLIAPSDRNVSPGRPELALKTTFAEVGSSVGGILVGVIKTTPPLLAGLGTEYYNLITTGKSGARAEVPKNVEQVKNIFGGFVLEPTTVMPESAMGSYKGVSTFIHEKIGQPIREQGINIPQRVQQPKTIGAGLGTAIGYGMMIPERAFPIRIRSIPLKVAPEGAPSEAEVPMVSRSVILGYGGTKVGQGGEIIFKGKELVSKTASGIKVGEVKPENILPEGYELRAKATRGEEFGTAQDYALAKVGSNKFIKYAEETGRAIPGTSETNVLLQNIIKTTQGKPTAQYEPTITPSTEKVTPVVGKAVLETNAQLSGILGKLNPLKGSGVQQGSGITKMYTKPEVAEKVFGQFPPQDIDIRVGNPKAGSNDFFGLSQRQALSQAVSAQKAIITAQEKERKTLLEQQEQLRIELKQQKTEAQGAKIIDIGTGEKLVEYTTQRSTEGEVASSLTPQGTLLGQPINYKVFKTKIKGSKYKGPHFGSEYQKETGFSQIMAFQTKETLSQQNAPKELIEKIGTKFFIGPKAFGEGKEIVRTLGLAETKALEFKESPFTYEKGVKLEADIKRLKEIYGPLYGIDFNKPVKGEDFTPNPEYFKSGKPSGLQASYPSKSLISIVSGKSQTPRSIINSTISSKSSDRSSISSAKSSISQSSKSFISGKSSSSSIISKSTVSGKSGKSAKSGQSLLSSISGGSDLSGLSIPSGPSGPSGASSVSSSSGFSSPSGSSKTSDISNISSLSNITNKYSVPSITHKSKLPLFGNLGRRRRYNKKEGPTAILRLGVENIFSSSLSIKGGQKIEF